MRRNFEGKSVLITGGGTGIGKATALEFAREGAAVLITGRREEKLAETAREAGAEGLGILFTVSDVSSEEKCRKAVELAVRETGGLDILFNNAGVLIPGPVHETTASAWETTFDTNVRGTWLMSKFAIPHMLSRGRGWIVNNASIVGLKGFAGLPAYAASKGAVIQLTRSMALEYSSRGINVNAVCPGTTMTPLVTEGFMKRVPDPGEGMRFMESLHPMGRLALPEEVARAVLFLCDERVGFVTGAALPVDGGWCAR
ncbi:MAG TPA: SDR family oxidoreductase [Thermodesulfobacteriota bacterium]|nr:SDR family oxidoreductase [Thermodesulfobacteriota bacterium]